MLFALAFFLLNQQTAPSENIIQSIADSGRCVAVAESPDQRVAPTRLIAPGLPPLLSFRYFEDKKNQRFANLDLMLDDAGH